MEFIQFIPEYLNLLLAAGCLFTLYKLEVLNLKKPRHKIPPKDRKRQGDTIIVVEPGLWKTMLRDRFAQTGVLLIAVPDIPVLIKIFSGG